jgi:hypothetical protein
MFSYTPGSKQIVKTSNGFQHSPVNKSKGIKRVATENFPDKIAKDNDIGVGTVTDIHKQSRNNGITDIESRRKIAIILKEEGIDVNYYLASSVN